jgi:hypothetical protein
VCDISDPFSDPEPETAFRIARAVARLTSLRDDSALGVPEAVACGPAAIPALRRVLFGREPSGLYEPRRHAVAALAELGAYDVLAEYLAAYLATVDMIADPVEKTGDEAVVNAAARALAEWPDETVLPRLLALTQHAPLAGVVDALARLRCIAAIPYFVRALAEDFTRCEAEEALRSFGEDAVPALLEAAHVRIPADGLESASSLRRRRSVLALLAETGLGPEELGPGIEAFLDEEDATLAILGCRILLTSGAAGAAPAAIRRLIDLLPVADLLRRIDIEDCLVTHFEAAREHIAEALEQAGTLPEETRLACALRRVLARAAIGGG